MGLPCPEEGVVLVAVGVDSVTAADGRDLPKEGAAHVVGAMKSRLVTKVASWQQSCNYSRSRLIRNRLIRQFA